MMMEVRGLIADLMMYREFRPDGDGLTSPWNEVASDFKNPVHVDSGSWLILANRDLEK
jgi:hypothetical protein